MPSGIQRPAGIPEPGINSATLVLVLLIRYPSPKPSSLRPCEVLSVRSLTGTFESGESVGDDNIVSLKNAALS